MRQQSNVRRSGPGALLAAGLAAVGLATLAAADNGGNMAGGDTGSLPLQNGAEPGANPGPDQAFYLTGDRAMLALAVVEVSGPGYVRVFEISDGNVWVEFYGDLRLRLDESVLRTGLVSMGVVAGFEGGGMRAALDLDRDTRPSFVPMGGSLEIPYNRLQAAGFFERSTNLRTRQSSGLSGDTSFVSRFGFLTVSQRFSLQPPG